MTSWAATVSNVLPEHWGVAQRVGFWDTQNRRHEEPGRPALRAGDLVFFIGSGPRGQALGMVRATSGQEPITDGQRPWSPADPRDYRWRFSFELLSNEVVVPTTRAESLPRLALDAGNQEAVRRITNEDGARWLRLRVEGHDVLFTEDVENLAASVEQEVAAAVDASKDSRERVMVAIRLRQGQPAFRRSLLRAYDERCAVTGFALPSLLEAAHIVPHSGVHTNRSDNGLLLRADIHTLFDLRLLTVVLNNGYRVRCSPDLASTEYAGLDGRELAMIPREPADRPHAEHLIDHNSRCEGWL
ncbi:HNH endonuclease [Agilicoccus flavus]|uniref:HNH endonuclease n=1 Tax=Agilicoccus flavus TaxID=2775968 RepID=UPI001CF61EC7|nr:HNH endonuclease [Agilicoccus flavus]